MKYVEVKSGVGVVILHNDRKLDGVVNGDPYVVAVAGVYPTETETRVPVHIPETNSNIHVPTRNLWEVRG